MAGLSVELEKSPLEHVIKQYYRMALVPATKVLTFLLMFSFAPLATSSLHIGPEVIILNPQFSWDHNGDAARVVDPFPVDTLSFHDHVGDSSVNDCRNFKQQHITFTRDRDEKSPMMQSLYLQQAKFHVIVNFYDEYKVCQAFNTKVYDGTEEPCQEDDYRYLYDQHTGERTDQQVKRSCVQSNANHTFCQSYAPDPDNQQYWRQHWIFKSDILYNTTKVSYSIELYNATFSSFSWSHNIRGPPPPDMFWTKYQDKFVSVGSETLQISYEAKRTTWLRKPSDKVAKNTQVECPASAPLKHQVQYPRPVITCHKFDSKFDNVTLFEEIIGFELLETPSEIIQSSYDKSTDTRSKDLIARKRCQGPPAAENVTQADEQKGNTKEGQASTRHDEGVQDIDDEEATQDDDREL